MKQIPNYGDDRQLARCVYCAGSTETRDHIPSRILLDEPYPANLPVVPACKQCNNSFSLDEEYLACLIDCTINGSATPTESHRPKVRRILSQKPTLAAMLTRTQQVVGQEVFFTVDMARVQNVILKLARGHAAYELNEPQFDKPSVISFMPIMLMNSGARARFEAPLQYSILPEVGSRGMQRYILSLSAESNWITVQEQRYRYLTWVDDSVLIRMVLGEYLACEIVW